MRVLLSTYGSRGDVEPLAGLAVALQALGAEAVVCAPADLEFLTLLDRAGVPFAPAFRPVRDWIEEALRRPRNISAYAATMIGAQHEAIDAAAEDCDLVVATGLMPSAAAAQCVAETRGLPYVHVSFCPLFLPSEHHRPFPYPGHPLPEDETDLRRLWALNDQAMTAIFGEPINTHRTAVGLPAVASVRDHVFTDRPWLASDPVLWPWEPTDLCDAVQTGAWVLPDDRPLSPELEAFLGAGPPPVYVGFGSIALPSTREAARAAVQAIRDRGRRIVLARGWADNAPLDDGADCLSVGEVNQQALFRRVAAAVHHGGAGTTAAAARAGAPQLIVPQVVDQPFWAARVAELGAGFAHDGPTPSVASLAEGLETVLAPETAARAAEVARTMSADGAMRAAKLLLDPSGQAMPSRPG